MVEVLVTPLGNSSPDPPSPAALTTVMLFNTASTKSCCRANENGEFGARWVNDLNDELTTSGLLPAGPLSPISRSQEGKGTLFLPFEKPRPRSPHERRRRLRGGTAD